MKILVRFTSYSNTYIHISGLAINPSITNGCVHHQKQQQQQQRPSNSSLQRPSNSGGHQLHSINSTVGTHVWLQIENLSEKSKLCSAVYWPKQYTVAIRKKTAEKKISFWFTADKSADSTALQDFMPKKTCYNLAEKKQNTKDNYKILVEDLSSETKQNWRNKQVQLTLFHFTLVVFTDFSFIIWNKRTCRKTRQK